MKLGAQGVVLVVKAFGVARRLRMAGTAVSVNHGAAIRQN